MVQVPACYGEWVMGVSSMHFVMDTIKGGRMFDLNNECTYHKLVEFAQADFGLDKNCDYVELSYSLPESMVKQMGSDVEFPPIYITNDSGVRNLIELARSQLVRLCVSKSEKGKGKKVAECSLQNEDDNSDGNYEDEHGSYANEDVDEDGYRSDSSVGDMEEDAHKKVGDDISAEENNGEDEVDEDYSKFGKVVDEDSEDVKFDFESMKDSLRRKGRVFMASWSDGIFKNKGFSDKDALISELRLTAVMAKFAYKVAKSTKTLFVAKCRVKGCKWQLRASVKDEPNIFWVTIYSKCHTCLLDERVAARKTATPKYIASLFYESTGLINGITPEHISICMFNMYNIKMDYTTAYRSLIYLHHLVRGSPEEGYAQLPVYLQRVQLSNPGTVTSLEVDPENRFKYVFMALGASIAGFKYLRRVVVVDGCHLPGKYGGVLLVATGQDGNFQLFPLAFAIVDSENDESWEWFFTKLSTCISDETGLTIISDRHMSIKKAIEKVFPWADRGICYYHLQNNIVSKFQGRHMLYLVKNAAYAYTLYDHDRYMAIIRHMNPALADYLVAADVKLWARVHFPGLRYNIQTSNIAESVNSMLKLARTFPIAYLLEFIRDKLSKWYAARRADALSLTTPHSRGVE